MIFEVSHRTHYRYATTVAQSQHRVHMTPRAAAHQTTFRHNLMVEPAPAMRHEGVDNFGNPFVVLEVEVPHKELVLLARSAIETRAPDAADFAATTAWDRLDEALGSGADGLDLDVIQYRCSTRITGATFGIADYASASFGQGRPVLDGAMDLTRRIYADFQFDPGATDVSTPVEQVFAQRRGVCQDFAHLALAGLRALRVPARYVSGYILTHPPPGQPKLSGADASHAWISVWSPETGWRDFDPTNGIEVGEEHITIAYGRDYNDVSPISGVLIVAGEHVETVGVDVVPLAAAPTAK
jgi:transglutaminase-like putative cysteine protease